MVFSRRGNKERVEIKKVSRILRLLMDFVNDHISFQRVVILHAMHKYEYFKVLSQYPRYI